MTVCPAKTQPGLIRVFAVRMKKAWVLSYPLSVQRRLWSDWVNTQADLSPHLAHSHFFWFCHEAAQICLQYWEMSRTGSLLVYVIYLSRFMTNPTKWHVRPAKTRISLGIHTVWSESSLCTQWVARIRLDGCPGWSESSLGAHAILLVLSWGRSFNKQSAAHLRPTFTGLLVWF